MGGPSGTDHHDHVRAGVLARGLSILHLPQHRPIDLRGLARVRVPLHDDVQLLGIASGVADVERSSGAGLGGGDVVAGLAVRIRQFETYRLHHLHPGQVLQVVTRHGSPSDRLPQTIPAL